jgi:hypothetical protein
MVPFYSQIGGRRPERRSPWLALAGEWSLTVRGSRICRRLNAAFLSIGLECLERGRFTWLTPEAAGAAAGSSAKCRRTASWNGDLGHLEGEVATMADTFAPIMISFSLSVIGDRFMTSSGVAKLPEKLPRVWARA